MKLMNLKGFAHIALIIFAGVVIVASISAFAFKKKESTSVDFQKNSPTEAPLATSSSSPTPSPKSKKYVSTTPTGKPSANNPTSQNSQTTNNNANSANNPTSTPTAPTVTNAPTQSPTSAPTPTPQQINIQIWVRGWQYTDNGHQYAAGGNVKIKNGDNEIASGSIGGDDYYKVSNMPQNANLTIYFYLYSGCGQSKQLTTGANSSLHQIDFSFNSSTSCL